MNDAIDFLTYTDTYFTSVFDALMSVDRQEINDSLNALLSAYDREATVFCFGNGGSAATASHLMSDLNKGISHDLEKKFHCLCLNDNMPLLTAIANDIGYEYVYSFQLEGNLKKNDVILAISGSGNSRNILRGVEYAKGFGCKVIGMTGFDGGRLWQLSDYHMHVPAQDIRIVEDVHMIFNHMISKTFREVLSCRP